MEAIYENSVFFPMTLPITVMVAALVAGPAIKNTIAAPGDSPFINNTAAMGTEPVAQTYKGMDAKKHNCHAQVLIIEVGGKEIIRNEYCHQRSQQKADDQPFRYILKKFYKSIMKHLLQFASTAIY
jgi:hypothetical protein